MIQFVYEREGFKPTSKEAIREIRNAVMHSGKVPSVRKLMTALGYKSPRSAMLLMEELAANGFLKRKTEGGFRLVKDLASGAVARTVSIPLVGTASCGPLMLAEENVEAMIQVSINLARPGSKYFCSGHMVIQ